MTTKRRAYQNVQTPPKSLGIFAITTTEAKHFVSICSVVSAARKQARNQFEVLLDAFTGNS
jgi:hypothetical protein